MKTFRRLSIFLAIVLITAPVASLGAARERMADTVQNHGSADHSHIFRPTAAGEAAHITAGQRVEPQAAPTAFQPHPGSL